MTDTLKDRAPRVRCYECGSERIAALCHHCQRPMCEEHSPPAFRQDGLPVRKPDAAAANVYPASHEFAGLGLDGVYEAVYHCADHDHVVRAFPRIWVLAGAGIAGLGAVLLFVTSTVGLWLLLLGAAVGGLPLLIHLAMAARADRPPLPLVPQVDTIEVKEQLTAAIRLERGRYTSRVEAIKGELVADMATNDSHTPLQAYRRKFRLPQSEPVGYSGGYLMLEGEVGLDFRSGQPLVLPDGTGVWLSGSSDDDEGLFPVDSEQEQQDYQLVVNYEVQDARRPTEIPLWIVPSLVPGSDRRALEIDLHWNPLGTGQQELRLATFDLVEVEVPVSWGHVESFAPDRVEIGRRADRRTIRWRQLKPDPSKAGSLTLMLQFERPIEIPAAAADRDEDGAGTELTLTGTIEATFKGLLSGVTGVSVYLPGGGSSRRPPTTTQTQVAVTFGASLRLIRYQTERVVPDKDHPDDRAQQRHRADEFHGVVPDYRTVAEVTNAVSMSGYYVKSVVEHPPYRDDGRPGVVNRVWDITGRLYTGLFPVDFDINLRGEDVAAAGGRSGKTAAQVTVKGAYAMGTLIGQHPTRTADDVAAAAESPAVETDSPDDDLLRKIEDTWIALHGQVTGVLARLVHEAGGGAVITDSVETFHHGELIAPGRAGRQAEPGWQAEPAWQPETANGRAAAAVVPDAAVDAVADLRQRRKAAESAVIAGTISEDTYRVIIAGIDMELKALGESA